jgi:alkylmercury lyase
MITNARPPSVDEYWRALEPHLQTFTPEEQRVAVSLYDELARGAPVDAAQLALALGVSTSESQRLLERDALKRFAYCDDRGRVIGFGGLATAPMHHAFEVDDRALWTWCAWDSLFIPEILGRSARVTSPDPETGKVVRLVVSPDRVESVDPNGVLISFVQPDAQAFEGSAANVMAQFCHFIYFFSSRSSGECWVSKHPGAFLYSLDEAFELAKRLNARNFRDELVRRASIAGSRDSRPVSAPIRSAR